MMRLSTERIATSIALMVLLVTAYLLYQLLSTDTTIATQATTLLAILTGLYVLFTFRIMNETKKQREQDIQPAFAIQPEPQGVKVSNVGNGPALRADLFLSLISKDSGERVKENEVSIQKQDIPADEFVAIPYGGDSFGGLGIDQPIGEMYDDYELKFTGQYTDLYQNDHSIQERNYDLTISEHRAFTDFFGTEETMLREISEQFDDLNMQMESVVRELKEEEEQ